MNKQLKIGLAVFFTLLLIIGILTIFVYRETIFKNDITIEYDNGCTERYINGELVTPECELEENTGYQGDTLWNLNLTQLNQS